MDNKNKKMSSKNSNQKPTKKKKSKFLLIFICIFMSIILAVGLVLGIIAYVKRKNAAVIYGSYMLDVGETNYFASYFKYRFLVGLSDSGVSGSDDELFWETESENGKTYGQLLSEGFREYISGILVANALFDRYSSYEDADKAAVDRIVEGSRQKWGSEEKFNEDAKKYGFDFEDYEAAVELIYKATKAQIAIFGIDGSNLSSFPGECVDFYENNYTRVSLLFLNESMYVEEDGTTRPLDDKEKQDRAQYAEALRTAIYNSENNTSEGPRITPEMYYHYYQLSDSDMEMYKRYYLYKGTEVSGEYRGSDATEELEERFPEVVKNALEMKEGDYREVKCDIGTCFIYKEKLDENAYSTDKENPFFSDFNAMAVYGIYSDMLALYAGDVEFGEKFEEVDILALPYNREFAVGIAR